ncbi:MAG: hypothetical protein AAGA56_28010, partial [Myxococcota bacterium]
MPRRREVPKRNILPDPKYKDKLVAKFINTIMLDGKKATAERALYGAFDIIQDRFTLSIAFWKISSGSCLKRSW